MTDWTNTPPYEQAIDDGCAAAGIYPHAHPTGAVLNAILNGLDAAGLLVTPARLNAIAETIEANKDDFIDGRACVALDCAAAIVRHSMPAVTA